MDLNIIIDFCHWVAVFTIGFVIRGLYSWSVSENKPFPWWVVFLIFWVGACLVFIQWFIDSNL